MSHPNFLISPNSYLCFPCSLGTSLDLPATHGGAQPGPFPHRGAWGCGVMEELSFGCFGEAPGLLQDLKVLGPPPPPGWSITAHLWLLSSQPPCPAGTLEPWNALGWDQGCHSLDQVPWKGLPHPEDESRGPWSRGVGEPEGLGGPCLLPSPRDRGVRAPGLVPPFHFQIPQIITVFASSCDRND